MVFPMPYMFVDEQGGVYSPDRKVLVRGPQDCAHYTILDGTEELAKHAFHSCEKLVSVVMPDSVRTMRAGVFSHCTALETCVLSNSLTELAMSTFFACTSLKEVSLPPTIEELGAAAFHHCAALKQVEIPLSVKSIKAPAFSGCSCEILLVSDYYRVIGKALYADKFRRLMHCPTDATEFIVSETVCHIERNTFTFCEKLQQITILPTLLTVDGSAITACPQLKRILIPKGTMEHYRKQLWSNRELLVERE